MKQLVVMKSWTLFPVYVAAVLLVVSLIKNKFIYGSNRLDYYFVE
jgi:hypothetical protein